MRAQQSLPPPAAGTRRPYRRPMAGWWRRNPFFVRYMIREATALVVAAYAVELLVGVLRLAQGPEAFAGWLEALRSPLSIAWHLLLLAGMLYHTWSWFEIMPKTMPPVLIGGRRVSPGLITGAGLAAAAIATVATILLALGLAS